jgi:hypothetical protein
MAQVFRSWRPGSRAALLPGLQAAGLQADRTRLLCGEENGEEMMLRCEPADVIHAATACDCHPAARLPLSGRRGFLKGMAAIGATAAVIGRGSGALAQSA